MGRAAVSLLLVGLAAFAAPAEEWTAAATLARDRVLVNANIASVGPYAFLLDSCISQGILHEGVDLYLSLPRAGATSDGTPIVVADAFEFGPVTGGAQEFLVKDLTPLSEITGADVAGILPLHQPGLEVTLDFPGKHVIWRSLDQAELMDESAAGSVPLRFDADGTPVIQVLIGGKRLVNARIDTAFGGVLALPESACREAGIPLEQTLVTLLPEGRERRQVLIESASAGAARLRKCLCDIATEGEPARIGLGFLRPYRVTLNYEHALGRIESAGNSDLIAPSPSGTGIVPARQRDGRWTIGIVSGSPAAITGITPEHKLVQVNGRKAAQINPLDLQAQLNGRPGEVIRVLLQLGTDQQQYELPCAALLRQ